MDRAPLDFKFALQHGLRSMEAFLWGSIGESFPRSLAQL